VRYHSSSTPAIKREWSVVVPYASGHRQKSNELPTRKVQPWLICRVHKE
jgi:hypothetical protein